MAALAEDHLWSGTGMSGQISGLDGMVAAGNTITFAGNTITNAQVWSLMEALNDNKLPRMGRLFVASKLMSRLLTDDMVQTWPNQRELYKVPLIDSSRPAEEATTGRLWLLSGQNLRVGFYGNETEVAVHMVPQSSIRKVGFLRAWDFVVTRDSAIRVMKV